MSCALLLLAVFAFDPNSNSETVYGQMRAANSEVKSLYFEFRCTEAFTPRIGKPEPTREKHFGGRAWFSEPNHLRVEYTEGEGLSFSSNPPTETRIAVSDNSVSRVLVTNQKSGFSEGNVTEGVTAFIAVPGLSWFWPRVKWDFESKYLQFDKIAVSQVNGLLRLSGRGWSDKRRIQWDIDPSKGFSYVSERTERDGTFGKVLDTASYELFEPKPGIWLPRRIVIEHRLNGEMAQHTVAELMTETVSVNESLPDRIFELPFPTGATVMNSNQKTSYIEGGGTSRSRESVTKLASEAKQLDAAGPIAAPGVVSPSTGALTSESSSRSTVLWTCGVLFLLLIGGMFGWKRWRTRR